MSQIGTSGSWSLTKSWRGWQHGVVFHGGTAQRDDAVHLEEMDVVPGHGRRGLGARLLEHVCSWAQARGHASVTLSTFRDVPWNAPFYRKHGFRDLQPEEWSPSMRSLQESEARHGLRVEARVFMRRDLPQVVRSEEAGRPCDTGSVS